MTENTPEPLLDPDCRDGKHGSCVGDPCECGCHRGAPAAVVGTYATGVNGMIPGQTAVGLVTAERDALKAAIERVRTDCEAVIAGDGFADDNPPIWTSGAQAHAKRVLAILNTATAATNGPSPVAKAFMAWVEDLGYRPEKEAQTFRGDQ